MFDRIFPLFEIMDIQEGFLTSFGMTVRLGLQRKCFSFSHLTPFNVHPEQSEESVSTFSSQGNKWIII
jgi:hypothetical protein